MTLGRKAATGVIANYARFGVPLVVTFLVTPVVVRTLGPGGFGLWSLTLSVVGFLGLLDLGLTTGTVRFVGEARGRGDIDGRNRAVATLAVLYATLAVVSLVTLAVLAGIVPDGMQLDREQRAVALGLLWLLGLRVAVVQLPLGLFRSILFAEQRIPDLAVVQSVTAVVNGGAVFGVLAAGGGLLGMGIVHLAVGVLEHAAYVWLAARRIPDLRVPLADVQRSEVWRTLRFGLSQLVVNVASLIRLRTDPIIIKMFVSLPAVGVYAIGLKVAEYAHLLVMQGLNVVTALSAELHGADDQHRLQDLFLRGGKYALALAGAVAVTASAVGTPAIVLWVGPSFAAAGPILAILTVATACSALGASAGGLLSMTGHHRRAAWVAAGSAVVNVVVSVLLVGPLGLAGVALGSLCSSILSDAIVLPLMACRAVRVPIRVYVRRVIAPAIVPVVLQGGTLLAVVRAGAPASLGQVLAVITLGGVVWSASLVTVGLDQSERSFLVRRVRAVGSQIRKRPRLLEVRG
jgi:O-antigen/teichoic acid export membrane protein